MLWNCNFTHKHYFEVLDYAKKYYSIGSVGDFHTLKKKSRFIILRHDVDYSLDYALRMAREEANHGLKSTYFVLLHSPYYNALSERSISLIKEISLLGHEIGLHYDTDFISSKNKKAINQIESEVNMLSNVVGKSIFCVSQHNVTITPSIKDEITSKFLDTKYSEISQSTTYFSDSVQNWRRGCMCNHIDKVPKLHILTHPIWWWEKSRSRYSIFKNFIKMVNKQLSSDISRARKIHVIYLQEIEKVKKSG